MTLKQQLVGNFVLAVIALCLIGLLGVMKLDESSAMTQNLVEQEVPQMVDLFKLHVTLDKYHADLIAHTGSEEAELGDRLEKQVLAYQQDVEDRITALHQNDRIDDADIQILASKWRKLTDIAAQVLEKSKNYMKEDATTLVHGDAKAVYTEITGMLDKLIADVENHLRVAAGDTMALKNEARNLITAIIVIALLAAIATNLFIIANVTRSLKQIKGVLQRVAQGDLTVSSPRGSNDEISDLMNVVNETVQNLREMISGIVSVADTTAKSANLMAASSETAKSAMLRQKEEVDQVKLSIDEMIAASEQIARTTQLADEATHTSQSKASNGYQLVEDSISITQGLLNQISISNTTVSDLEVHSQNIGSVLDVIKSIAEQTNLLALNAAIEAARAGDSGRGFAVVADEVRTLAQRSHVSAEEIQKLIDKLHSTMTATVAAMDKSQEQGETSVRQAEVTGEALRAIDEAVSTIVDSNRAVLNSIDRQTRISNDVSSNISAISELMQVTASSAIEVADLSRTLNQQVESIERIAGRFKL